MRCVTLSLALSSIFSSLPNHTNGYEIGCVYPDKWIDNPFDAQSSLSGKFSEYMALKQVETPIVVRLSHHSTMCRGMCLSLHDEAVLDPFDLEESFTTVPPYGQNAWAIVMCIAQCYLHILHDVDDFYNYYKEDFEEIGLDLTLPEERGDIRSAWIQKEVFNNLAPMMNILVAEDYHPLTMGHVAGFKVRFYADDDGWNSNGSMSYSKTIGDDVPCTGSCRLYQDTIGYEPVPDPRIHTFLSDDDSKYDCTGYCRRWQPLQEGDGVGSLKRQEFTMPHIGLKAKTYLRDVSITLQDPEYDLYQESLDVIERVRDTATDVMKQDAIQAFDGKLGVRGMITLALRGQFGQPRIHSYQDEVLFKVGLSSVEYDAVVQAWAEKAYHDLVRPTTVIKHWDDDQLFTFSGDRSMPGPTTINARDFEAYIRVMPHAEYPSGSSCLCTSYYEFSDIFFEEMYGEKLETIEWFGPEGTGRSYILENMEALRDICGESRLWGGMHYAAAIPGGEQVCSGLGQLAYSYIQTMKNGSEFNTGDAGGPWYWGDELPSCSTSTDDDDNDYKYIPPLP